VDWSLFPVKEMIKRGWIHVEKSRIDAAKAAELARLFVEQAMGGARVGVLARRTVKGDAFTPEAICALTAWQARVLQKAAEPAFCPLGSFHIDKLSEAFLRELVAFSPLDDGPLRAVNHLRQAGIAVVVEEHLTKTKLDGAAMLSGTGMPVIGLTLRFDRLDNFWFTLMHECAHIWKHLSRPGDVILDRLVDAESTEAIEKEANRIARDALIPRAQWRSASVRQLPTKSGILSFAREQGIHPAIVAGRLQREAENYAIFKDLVGQGALKPLFTNR
jgi:HTH-type transcriptional regulator/antitoxin HigA